MQHKNVLTKSEIDALDEVRYIHPFNAKAIRNTKAIGERVGLRKIGIHLVRIEPGDETTEQHNHECADEFVYILSGTAALALDNETYRLTGGDFVGFPANGATHSMKNIGTSDSVYLLGGIE